MSDPVLTRSQQEAVNARSDSVLVSAGAGSGKTTVLVSRLVNYIEKCRHNGKEININDFVIITFTKAAANELRSKISERLSKEALKDPGSLHLRKQIALCSQAKIGTIHSFCAQLLRQYSKEAGVSPDFTIISDERRQSLRVSSLDKVLDRYYSEMESHPGFDTLVNSVSPGGDDSQLVNLVLSLHENMMSHPQPRLWAEQVIDGLEKKADDAGQTPWGRELLSDSYETVVFWSGQLNELIGQMQYDPILLKAYVPAFSELCSYLDKLSAMLLSGWDDARNFLSEFKNPKLSRCSKTEMPELAERAKAAKTLCTKYVQNLTERFDEPSDRLLFEMESTARPMKVLLGLTLDFDEQFRNDKARQRFLDYNDLEHLTFEMLQGNPELRKTISDRYVEIMVDEYQDVNAVQDAIFSSISNGGKKLFMVGDIKQSIYRFRLADPSIFIRKCETSSPIALNENFRSRKEIIDAVNRIFEKCMSKHLGDVDYNEDSRLKFGATYYNGSVPEPELLVFERTEDDNKYAFEASRVGQQILKLVNEGYRFGDITVLMRSLSAGVSSYCDEFAKLGIPVETSQSNSFFAQPEVADIVNILRAVDNPHNDVALMASLRSASFTADELSEIRSCDKGHNLYSALTKCGSDKCRAFVDLLKQRRADSAEMTMDRFLMSLGWPVSANLLKLAEMAVSFENDGYHGLHRFVKYLERLRDSGSELKEANLSSDSVHIMSIHKSKGLEFPVVFLCDTCHEFNNSDSKQTVLVHPQLGLGPKYVDFEKMVYYPTLARRAISLRLEKEGKGEEMRLLYVALTRAKERLIITASPKDTEKDPPMILENARCFYDWIRSTDIPCRVIPYDDDFVSAGSPGSESTKYSELPVINYPYMESVSVPASVTATELKKLSYENTDSISIAPSQFRHFRKPDLSMTVPGASGSERGTAMHKALEHIDFSKPVSEELRRLLDRQFISKSEYELIDEDAIEAFLNSPLGIRIKASPSVRREFKFLLLVDAGELLNTGVDEKVLLNGVVDCCFEEDDGMVIVDYKTDRQDRTEEYTPQIKAYILALERIFGKKVKEAYLYYLNLGYEKRIAE